MVMLDSKMFSTLPLAAVTHFKYLQPAQLKRRFRCVLSRLNTLQTLTQTK